MKEYSPSDFPCQTFDKVRFADLDRQGHVNNAMFATFLETGRVEFLYNPTNPLLDKQCSFVIVSMVLDFAKSLTWPGQVEIGTGVTKIGNSSLHLFQQLFQDGDSVAQATTTIVQVHDPTGRSHPLTPKAKQFLSGIMLT